MNTKFYYYKHKNNYLFSKFEYNEFQSVTEEEVKNSTGLIYYLNKIDPLHSRRGFSLSHGSLLNMESESLNLLRKSSKINLPSWVSASIDRREIKSVNTNYPNWEMELEKTTNKKWKVNIIALGDVGSTLAIGLVLMGGDCIDEIGLCDRDINRLNRWKYELNQVRRPFHHNDFPKINIVEEKDLFDCDMFVFCASKGIPAVGSPVKDVRMAQFESNSQIISKYAKLARDNEFKGLFAVVSDPVDLLCKVAFLESNKNKDDILDFKGLASNQIIGYGLGVMNARACFYAEQSENMAHYLQEGRVFGPHGEGLIVANSIENYQEDISNYLTEKTVNANKEVRGFGFKPFIAPSLSSGSLSLIATIRGEWFYGSTYMNEVYMGSKCRLLSSGIELEQLNLPDKLYEKLTDTYEKLANII